MYLWLLAFALFSYLLSGLNFSIIFSRLVYHEDIRTKGSGNAGFTNFKRVYGGKLAIAVFLLDAMKAIIPSVASLIVFENLWNRAPLGVAVCALASVLGHCYPVWYRFRGGKGVLVFLASSFFIDWRAALIAAAIFLILLFTVKYMSLGSMCFAASFFASLFIFGHEPLVYVAAGLSAALVIYRHHANIARLIAGTESKFHLFKKK